MSRERRQQQKGTGAEHQSHTPSVEIAPGKRTHTEAQSSPASVQRKRPPAGRPQHDVQVRPIHEWMYDPGILAAHGFPAGDVHTEARSVQAKGNIEQGADIHGAAAQGVESSGNPLPHLARIQQSFGAHEVDHVKAHADGNASTACDAIGAVAYTRGEHVAFSGTPDLHTAAHEAAHVVQQRGGVQLAGGVGQTGDPYEQHADAVADAVVAGRSAEALLDRMAPSPGGRAGAPGIQMAAGAVRPAVQMRGWDDERDRHGERGTEELDRRIQGNHGSQQDGSGDWGAEGADRGFTDRANHYMWTRIALAAESMGLPNAARHMRHYLGNTGQPLEVDPDLMLRDVSDLQDAYDRQTEALRAKANQRAFDMTVTGGVTFTLSSSRRSDVYCRKDVSQDWFYAIGGFTYWVTVEVTLEPPETEGGPVMASMVTRLHIFDRYNWDQGKSVTIAGMTITDEQLGRLHRVGLAREYEVHGTSSPRTITWEVSAHSSTDSAPPSTAASERAGGRSDPSRERGRHFDNVRGSE